MSFVSINPATGERIGLHRTDTRNQMLETVANAHTAFAEWRTLSFVVRAQQLRQVARTMRKQRDELASLLTAEMGKPILQSRAEIEKSATVCDYYASHAAAMLAPQVPANGPRGARISFEPLGVVLAIMPWNFPFWQTFRAAAPALMAGNTFLLKPAPNTAGCGLAIERLFAALPYSNLLQTLLVETSAVPALIADQRVRAVTLTGSTRAGQAVAALAGAAMKPGVFELGGSDAYLILDDADLALAASLCAQSRLINSGQSCIAAKRFIVVRSVKRKFEQRLVERFALNSVGDPADPATSVGPLARADLRDHLHRQVQQSMRRGAHCLAGGKSLPGPGFFYEPTILTDVQRGMPACDEELFGPVAAIIGVRDEAEAIKVANSTNYGLGAAIFSSHRRRAQRIAAQIEAGVVVINDFVRSDPALPFGGVKQSGYGRELGEWGLRSFVNIKTIVSA